MGRVDCFVSFHETDGDRTLMLSFRMDLPEYILAIGNQITHEGFKIGGKITELAWYIDGENEEATDVDALGDELDLFLGEPIRAVDSLGIPDQFAELWEAK